MKTRSEYTSSYVESPHLQKNFPDIYIMVPYYCNFWEWWGEGTLSLWERRVHLLFEDHTNGRLSMAKMTSRRLFIQISSLWKCFKLVRLGLCTLGLKMETELPRRSFITSSSKAVTSIVLSIDWKFPAHLSLHYLSAVEIKERALC